jgi:hypothetical protein
MDFNLFKEAYSSNSVPRINRVLGTEFDVTDDLANVKRTILETFCDQNSLEICDDEGDQIEAIIDIQNGVPSGVPNDVSDYLLKQDVVAIAKYSDNSSIDRIDSYEEEKEKTVSEPNPHGNEGQEDVPPSAGDIIDNVLSAHKLASSDSNMCPEDVAHMMRKTFLREMKNMFGKSTTL